MSSAASITSCVRSVNKTSADGRGSRFSSSLCRVRPVAALAHATSNSGRDFKRRPRDLAEVGASFLAGSGGHGLYCALYQFACLPR